MRTIVIVMSKVHNFQAVNRYLANIPPSIALKEAYSLDRIERLMAVLGSPEKQLKIIHVAGTSGKTSTCYYVAALLHQAGQKVGLTVSPHVEEINERVQINLQPLAEAKFCDYFNEFLGLPGVTQIGATYFETMIGFAYWVFAYKEKVDYAVIEVGVGGLGDSTNVASRADKLCLITDIGYDHMHILGNTIEKITAQKAGIIKPHNRVFVLQQAQEVLAVVNEVASQQGAELTVVSDTPLQPGLPPFAQRDFNIATAAYEYLAQRDNLPRLTAKQLQASQVVVPARMEIFKIGGKTIILDGSHNQQKLAALAAGLQQRFPDQAVAAMMAFVAARSDRLDTAVKQIVPLTKRLIATGIDMRTAKQDVAHLGLDPELVGQSARAAGAKEVTIIADPLQALKALLASPEPVLLVTGSFYLMNHIRPLVRKQAKEDD